VTQYGRYDPKNSHNTSALFSYQEVPVTSAKINRWNGNLAAAFELLHRICSALFTRNRASVITVAGNGALRIDPADPPGMTVRIQPGWAMLENSFAGVLDTLSIPGEGVFQPPSSGSRIDLIVLSGAGALQTVVGEASVSPEPPSPPPDAVVLAHVFHRAGAVRILGEDDGTQSYIMDVRPRLVLGEAHHHGPDTVPPETPDGVRRHFSLQHACRSGSLEVYVNGVLQHKNVDFSEDADGRGYTFTYSPLATYKIQHRYLVDHEIE